jgi:hypothetical protein
LVWKITKKRNISLTGQTQSEREAQGNATNLEADPRKVMERGKLMRRERNPDQEKGQKEEPDDRFHKKTKVCSDSPKLYKLSTDKPAQHLSIPQILIQIGNSLHVGNMSRRLKERDLREKFAKFGPISDVKIVVDPTTRESRGFGFVSFERAYDADDCIKEMDGEMWEGR